MKDELEFLTKETFLLKKGETYETSFPIISRTAQEKIYAQKVAVIEEITANLITVFDTFDTACRRNSFFYYGSHVSYETAKWVLLPRAYNWISADVIQWEPFAYRARPDGGVWEIIGYQEADIADPPFVGQHGSPGGNDAESVNFQEFKYSYQNIGGKTPCYLEKDAVSALHAVCLGATEVCYEKQLQMLAEYGYVHKTENGYVPAVVVFSGYSTDQYWQAFSEAEKAAVIQAVVRIRTLIETCYQEIRTITVADLPAVYKNDQKMCDFICRNNGGMRDYVCDAAIRSGWLMIPAETDGVIGAYLYL